MASVEEILASILEVLKSFRKPSKIICGYTANIGLKGTRLTEKQTRIRKAITVRVRTLGTGTYIALGDEDEQPYRLTAANATHLVDYIDDVSKVIAVTDAGTTGELEWIGG